LIVDEVGFDTRFCFVGFYEEVLVDVCGVVTGHTQVAVMAKNKR
jgi:hypothetical protein